MSTSKSQEGQISDDEEPDYMSDDFLKQCVQTDIRPGLLTSRATKRTYDLMDGRKSANKTRKELEKERILSVNEALKVPIKEDNKGFQMLQRMGYKPGSSLGKDYPQNNAIKEPIKMDIKTNRAGLGQERHQKEKVEQFIHEGNAEFRLRKQSVVKAREVFYDLKKARFACQTLDESKGIIKPTVKWYWPDVKKAVKEEEEQGLLIEESEADAGPDAVVLKRRKGLDDEAESSESESDHEDEDDSIPDEVKLDSVFNYLRDNYFYCLWCGAKYENLDDMESSCPGTDRDSH